MNRRRGLSIWFANRAPLIASFLLAGSFNTAIACDESLMTLLGPDRIHARQEQNRMLRSGHSHYLDAAPPELARTARENLPMFHIAHRLNPIREGDRLIIDAYLGLDYASKSPDVFVMPLDSRAVCILAPESVVFLSDDATHHYATIDSIDFATQSVTLVDPWASVSFLLPGRNLLGIRAEAIEPAGNAQRIKLSIGEFLRVLRGFVEASDPQRTFEAIEKIYPELAGSEDYLFWKYSRVIGTGRYDDIIAAVSDLQARDDIASKPRLKLLLDFANDITGVVFAGVPREDRNGNDDTQKAFNAFLDRAEGYIRLPWSLRWLLIDRSTAASDNFVLSVADRLLRADPQDVDVRIAKAQSLTRLQRAPEALAEADLADEQWTTEVRLLIQSDTREKAVETVFDSPIKLVSLNVFRWRYGRIRLAQLTSTIASKPGTDVSAPLQGLLKRYPASRIDFLYEFLHLYSLSSDPKDEDALIDTAVSEIRQPSKLPSRNELNAHVAHALYRFFRTDRSVDTNRPSDRRVFATAVLREEICRLSDKGLSIRQPNRTAADALQKVCRR